jgi:hypothetical protein
MTPSQLKARATKMKTYENKEGYWETSYARRKKKLDSGLYYDDRIRVQ